MLEPEESKASTEAFVLKNNLVYYRESYTSLYLRETANKRGYIIWQQKNIDIIDASPGLIAGAIIDGKISFNSQLKTTGEYAGYADSINNLKNNYDFDTASKQFIPKK